MELLTIRETARKYNLSETMLRQRERAGKLPGVYTGKQGRVKRVNVRQLMEQLEAESAAFGRDQS